MTGIYFQGYLPPGSDKPHICIVLNKIVKSEDDVLYVFMTSQVDKIEKILKKDRNAIAYLDYEEYSKYFNDPEDVTCIACDKAHLYEIKAGDLKDNIDKRIYSQEDRVNDSVVSKIKRAISNSKSYDKDDLNKIPG